MTQFSEDELNRIARLSGLSLSEKEKEILYRDLMRIVPYMERISELDTNPDSFAKAPVGVKSAGPDEVCEDVLREDVAVESGISEAILRQAPKSTDGMFTVPRTVE